MCKFNGISEQVVVVSDPMPTGFVAHESMMVVDPGCDVICHDATTTLVEHKNLLVMLMMPCFLMSFVQRTSPYPHHRSRAKIVHIMADGRNLLSRTFTRAIIQRD
jgi:hypothetical protein